MSQLLSFPSHVPPVPPKRVPLFACLILFFVILLFTCLSACLSFCPTKREAVKRERRGYSLYECMTLCVCVSAFFSVCKKPPCFKCHMRRWQIYTRELFQSGHTTFSPASVCLRSNYHIYLLDSSCPSLTVCFFLPRLLSF